MVVKNEKEPDPRAKRSRARKKKKKKKWGDKGPGQNLGMPKFLARCQCLVILL